MKVKAAPPATATRMGGPGGGSGTAPAVRIGRGAGQGDDGVEVDVGADHGGQAVEGGGHLRRLLGHRDQAQVAVPPAQGVVAGEGAEHRDAERGERLAEQGLVARRSRPG